MSDTVSEFREAMEEYRAAFGGWRSLNCSIMERRYTSIRLYSAQVPLKRLAIATLSEPGTFAIRLYREACQPASPAVRSALPFAWSMSASRVLNTSLAGILALICAEHVMCLEARSLPSSNIVRRILNSLLP
ncbi:MAG TPA: hypothetical protein DCP91_02225 [Eggerthellaceae bacterium]|nr:hypothetical protein [Eggerthellaceae bacterium]